MSSSASRLLGNFPSAQVSSALSRTLISPSAPSSFTAGAELISTITLTATASTFSWSNIPSSFAHLQLMGHLRGAGSSNAYRYGHIYVRFNDDAGATSYRNMKTSYYDNTITTDISNFGTYNGAQADIGIYTDNWDGIPYNNSSVIIDFPFIQEATNKSFMAWTTHSIGENSTTGAWSGYDAFSQTFGMGQWLNTNPVTKLSIGNFGSDWAIGSTLTLMGIRR